MNTSSENGNYTLSFSDLDQFYKESDEVEPTGSHNEWKKNVERDDPSWVGLPRDEIIKSKYCYKEGLDKLEELHKDFNIGGTKRTYKWSEDDGDDMNYDRYLDNLPSLKKRTYAKGSGRGKIVTLYVSIAENCYISYKEMLNRSYTIMRIVDYLENMNYRTEIITYIDIKGLGHYGEEYVSTLHIEIPIKKAEDVLIKGLILNCISPWMFRYHVFKLINAKFKTFPSYGQSYTPSYSDTENKIYFRTGECLSEASSKAKIEQLAEKFGFDE